MKAVRLAAAAMVALGTLAAPLAQAQGTAVPNTPENRALEAAKKGPQELRRFINRTRALYGLYFNDFYKAG